MARDLTIEILKDIRAEVAKTNVEVAKTNVELAKTNAEVAKTNVRLDLVREELGARIDELTKRVVESEIRTSTAIADLAGTVREMTSVLRASVDLRPRVERCEQDIAELKRRAG